MSEVKLQLQMDDIFKLDIHFSIFPKIFMENHGNLIFFCQKEMATLYFYRDPIRSSASLVYKIDNRLYDALDLAPIPYGSVQEINAYIRITAEDLSLFTSQPAIINTDAGYYLITSDGPQKIKTIIGRNDPNLPPIVSVRGFLLPNLKTTNVGSGENFPVYNLPPFDQNLARAIQRRNMSTVLQAMRRGGPPLSTLSQFVDNPPEQPIYLSQIRTGLPPVIPAPTKPSTQAKISSLPQGQDLVNMAIEAYFKRIYGLPIQVPNQIQQRLISFDQASDLLQKGQIVDFKVDPFLQSFIVSPSSNNRLLTFTDKNATIYYTIAQYDANKNSINPPQK
ncbi:hypothetical protein BH23THE1_BH23THE1_35080 [soil metagenome]